MPAKKHHYVPQYYLRNFATNEQVWCFDKKTQGRFPTNVLNVGHENYFYALPNDEAVDEKTRFILEEFFADVDLRNSNSIEKLLGEIRVSKSVSKSGNPLLELDDADRWNLAGFCVYQDLRTKETREQIAQLTHLFESSALKMIAASKFPEFKGEIRIKASQQRESLQHIQLLVNEEYVTKLANFCMNKVWIIGVNITQTPLFTSDHPVVRKSHFEGFMGGRGWGSVGVEIAVPLSPEVCLILLCPSHFREKDTNYSTAREFDGKVWLLDEQRVHYYNQLQFENSFRMLFSKTSDATFQAKLSAAKPHFTDPFRHRVSMSGGVNGGMKLPDSWSKRFDS